MEKSNFVTKLVSFLLFGAMLAYLSYYVVRAVDGGYRTAPAVYVELSNSFSVEGIIARRESLVTSSESYLSVEAENGQMLAVGETIAVAYSGEAALERAGRIHELELRKRYIETALNGRGSDADVRNRDGDVKSAVIDLAYAQAARDTDALAVAAVTLSSLVMEGAGITATQVELTDIELELNSLYTMSASDTNQILAGSAGLFFAQSDGYESMSPETIGEIEPQALRNVLGANSSAAPTNVVGKIVDPLEWFYAALVPYETAQRLRVGSGATLDFGRYCSGVVDGVVTHIDYADNGDCAVVFRLTGGTAETLYARKVTADILFDAVSGIRVPVDAVYEEQAEVENPFTGEISFEARPYVYTVTGLQAEKKYITIVWESPEFYLVRPESLVPDSLREGNEIIVTGREIYDGMMLE